MPRCSDAESMEAGAIELPLLGQAHVLAQFVAYIPNSYKCY